MAATASAAPSALAFEHARLCTMRGNEVLIDHTLVVRGERIENAAPSAQFSAPADALCIDATGWTLLPGLADMHVHLMPIGVGPGHGVADEAEALRRGAEYLMVMLIHGVTTVRNMAGTPLHLKLREAVRSGRMPGPRIHTTGPILETRFTFPALASFGQLVRTREEARAAVLDHQRLGYDSIKVYNDLDADIYDEIVATCREVGMPVVGHVAFAKGLDGALQARQDSIEHLRSYDFALDTRDTPDRSRFVGWLHTTPQRMREVAERTAEAGTWNVPTLVIERAVGGDMQASGPAPAWAPGWLADVMRGDDTTTLFKPEQLQLIRDGMDQRLQMVQALDTAGAPLLAGSDCPGCSLLPGRSLHDELALFVRAGMSPMRALQKATIEAARFLGVDDQLGSIEPGKLADLVVLPRDPAQDIAALRDPVGVVADGVWWPTQSLIASLQARA